MLQQPLTQSNYPLRCNLHFECFCIKKFSIEVVVKLQQVEQKNLRLGIFLLDVCYVSTIGGGLMKIIDINLKIMFNLINYALYNSY